MRFRAVALVLVALPLALLSAPFTSEAQKPGKVYRVGFLSPITRGTAPSANLDAFLQGLRERGWLEGENLIIEWRYAEGKLERLPHLAAELVGLKVDLILAVSTPGTRAAMKATNTVPIVLTLVSDPVGSGFVTSLARPGGNVTGLPGHAGLEMFGKQLQLLKEAIPKASRGPVVGGRASNPRGARS